MNVHYIKPLKIAVIGSGISGLSAAWLLNKRHDVKLFEKDDRLGGHTHTVDIETPEGTRGVDTGFIVYNPVNYPNLINLFDHLNVENTETDMTFGVSVDQGRIEYSGSGLSGFFAKRSQIGSPRHWRLLRDILRFYKDSDRLLSDPSLEQLSLGELLEREKYSQTFIHDHLIPMSAAIWSTPAQKMLEYPALTFMRFCMNHGLVQLDDRPQWRTVVGGSRNYVDKIAATLEGKIRLNAHIHKVHRRDGKVILEHHHGKTEEFDQVVMACHADQSLALLADPTPDEQRLLKAFPYQRNRAILHTDARQMPKRRTAWSAWNYLAESNSDNEDVAVTYWMNRLQPLNTSKEVFVTLNPLKEPSEGSILGSYLYDHPVFDMESIAAQKELWSLQGVKQTWFCGAWWGYGFHEDGLQSGLAVAENLGRIERPWQLDDPNSRIYAPTLKRHSKGQVA